jgi:5-formyltetrahydrofolate cyclo-ligase
VGLEILARHPCYVNGAMMINVNTAKEELRNNYKTARLAMSREEVISKSRIICQKLLEEVRTAHIKSLSIYKPLERLNEVDTSLFISEIQSRYPKIEIIFADSSKNQKLPAQKFDLIIVPLLAFDKNNYRLGWGGGWYDKFLAAQPSALKIGLCFQNGFVEAGIPREPHDIPLDKIITEV